MARTIRRVERAAEHPVLAIDLGGTQIRAALVLPDLEVACRVSVPTDDEEGPDAVLSRVADAAAGVLDVAGQRGLAQPVGAGISAPGPLDPWSGVILAPPNLAGWQNVAIVDRVASRIRLPTFLERDTNVAVTAEWQYGAARGARHPVYITVSTGVGGGVLVDGRILRGADGIGGEVGHLVVELDGPVCGCGGIGHVEAIASGTALAREGRTLVARGAAPELARLAATGQPIDAELVARAADAGDAACRMLLERAWVAVGALCASLTNLLDPEVIVIGGSIAEHRPRLFEVARREHARRIFGILVDRVRIEPASLGPDVSLIGLLPIVNDRIGDPSYADGSSAAPLVAAQQGAAPS
jgi:glucokinase